MNKYIMAIDAGTGSVRSVIFDESFNQIAVAQEEWTHKEDPLYPGAIDFDVITNKALMFKTINDVINKANIHGTDIISISTTSMREAFVLYDKDGIEIWAVSNVDARAIKEVSELQSIDSNMEYDVYMKSGQTFALGAIPRLLWVKNNCPEIYNRTKSITMLNDWITYCLTGVLSLEPSNGSTTGMLDAHKRNWDHSIIKVCGLKEDMYPPVFESGTIIGTVMKEIQVLTGLSTDCIVATGGGDVQMGCIGVGSIRENEVVLLGGSFWQLEYNTPTPSIDIQERIRVNCHAVPNMWQQELIAFYPGLVMRWFRDGFCQYESMIAKENNQSVYDILNEQSSTIPAGSYGMLCSFSSIMNFKTWKHPSPCFANFGINPETFNKATFYHSLLENAALVTLGHKMIIEDLFGKFPQTITFASGASSSSLWCQIVSDVLGVNVKVPVIKEATALGAALCAGLSIGLYPTIEEAITKFVKFEKTYTPNKENNIKYFEIFKHWKKLSETEMLMSDEGTLEHMWKAPGI